MKTKLSIVLLCVISCWQWAMPAAGQQLPGADRIRKKYTKTEVRIPMRDGKTLFAAIYAPRDQSQTYPILMKRTPYSCQPYGEGDQRYNPRIGPSAYVEDDGYIFVHQDVRGRWMSEGQYNNMRPHVDGDSQIDESSDTYDTIEWLLKNVKNNNGKVGIWGISYPGFYSAASLPEHHPALVCSSPQAPIGDFFFDDFHHQGAYTLGYLLATNTFGYQHEGPSNWKWYSEISPTNADPWKFYMDLVPLTKAETLFAENNFFWEQLRDHPNYDEFWKKRSILPHLKNVKTNVMTVGGWFDAEDLYGPLNIYRSLEKNNPGAFNTIVMGPWSHGDWSRRGKGRQVISQVDFGADISDRYQKSIEAPFFRHFLKGTGDQPEFEAMMFDTGTKQWSEFKSWPPHESQSIKLHLGPNGKLSQDAFADATQTTFVSDPANPVPYRAKKDIEFRFTPRPYMADDQRFASQRDDVLVFQTEPLTEPMTLTGDLKAHLQVATSQTDADWVVKLIDVYPDGYQPLPGADTSIDYNGFQQMVRSEVLRGRFRNSYEKPEPFQPGQKESVTVPLQGVCHTFQKGHRLMIQVQSSWFPLINRNPQKYVENIFTATAEDYVKANHTLFQGGQDGSYLEIRVLKK